MKRDDLGGLELASLIGDGESVDWVELEQSTRDGDELARIRSLRQIAQIAELHRTFQAEGQPEAPDERPPIRFAGMRLIESIGSGSFADVYRARDEQVGRDVALKILRRQADEGEIVREAHLLARVRHPNVAVVYGADRSDGKTGIWMELVEGETLEKKLRRDGPLPWREVARIGIDLCRALGAVHELNLVHRDVKAQNVMLSKDGRVVLTDFGVGQLVTEAAASSGDISGTPLYVAPELFRDEAASNQSDIYSLGVLLYRLVSAEFPVIATSLDELERCHSEGERVPLATRRPDLPAYFVATVERSLRPDRQTRYGNAREMEQALSSALSEGGRRRRHRALIAAGTMVALVVGYWALPSLRPANIPSGATIVLAELDNRTGDAELDAVSSLLASELRQSAHVRVMDPGRALGVLNRMLEEDESLDRGAAREVAWRESASLVVAGTLTREPSVFALSVQIDRVGESSPEPLRSWSRRFQAETKQELFEAVDEASRWIRATMGEQAVALEERDVPVREATTPSWQALDVYYRAERLKAEDRWEDSMALLEEAIDLDPEFALAHARLGDLRSSLVDERAFDSWEKALDAMEQRTLSKKEDLYIRSLYAFEVGRWAEAERLFRTYALMYPNESYPAFGHGMVLRTRGRRRDALTVLLEAETRDTNSIYLPFHVGLSFLTLGDFDAARRYAGALRDMEQHYRSDALMAAVHFTEGSYDEAERFFEALSESDDLWLRGGGVNLYARFLAERGSYDEARRLLQRSIDERGHETANRLLALAALETFAGNREASRRAAVQALEIQTGVFQLVGAGVELTRAGFLDEAGELGDRLAEHPDRPLFDSAFNLVDGEILLARNRPRQAVEAFRRAAAFPGNAPKASLARALARAGDTEEAFSLFGEIVHEPAEFWQQNILDRAKLPPGFFRESLFSYARLALELDRVEEARNLMTSFVSLDRGPDTEAILESLKE